ncbi:MAG: cation:dicarboxylase symporter family transporter, partial [Alphaproteobacteria bacterium]
MSKHSFIYLLIAIIAGVLTGLAPFPFVADLVNFFSQAFIHLLKLVSLPLIFLALVTTSTNFGTFHEIKDIGKQTIKYTILTTLLAAFGALGLYLLMQPRVALPFDAAVVPTTATDGSYWTYLLQAIPSNIIQPFIEHNVLGVLFLAGILSFALLHLPEEHRTPLKTLFNAFYAIIMKMTSWIVVIMPLAVWAFVAVLVKDLQAGISLQGFGVYLGIIVAANLFQAFVVLPILLRRKGIPVYKLAHAMVPALTTAFFAKSSAAAMPVAISCVEKHMHLPQRVARFCFPLCTSINMNACAAFILIT